MPRKDATHLNEVPSLKNISNFTHDDVIPGPSKAIKVNMLNYHLNMTRDRRQVTSH